MRAVRLGTALALVGLLLGTVARGDGGRLQLRERAGDAVLSIWTAPTPLLVGTAEVLVTIEPVRRDATLEKAEAMLEVWFEGECVASVPLRSIGRDSTASWAGVATFELREPGEVALRILRTERDGETSSLDLTVAVERSPSPLREHWRVLGFPFFAIALFGLAEWRRSRRRAGARPSAAAARG